MRVTSLDKRQAASMDNAGSNPTTFMPMAKAMSATIEPMAPSPTMPSVLPLISPPAKRDFSFSSKAAISAASFMWVSEFT